MRIFYCILVGITLSVSAIAQTTSARLREYFKAAQAAGIFNGTVRIVRGDSTLIDDGFGYKNVESKTLNDSNTIYQIGSITKQFTAVTILKLAEQKKLSISDKLSKYFPDFPNGEKINIENLLTHTSGIYNFTNDTGFIKNGWYQILSRKDLLAQFKDRPLDFEPGTKFNYSNSGYALLGFIIEKVTGKSYEEVVRQLIFKPAKMMHTGFDFSNLSTENKATGYYSMAEGAVIKARLVDSTVSFSAGAIYSTTADLVKWNNALLANKIITATSLKNAWTPRQSKYGFGFIIDSIAGKLLVSHNGGVDGFLSHNTIVPADSIQVVILSNNMATKITDVTKAVFSILYNHPYKLPEVAKETTLENAILKRYVGDYALAPTFKITITLEGNQLKAQATGQSKFDIFPKNEKTFFYKVVDAQIEFTTNENGEVTQLTLHQSGQHIPGKRVN